MAETITSKLNDAFGIDDEITEIVSLVPTASTAVEVEELDDEKDDKESEEDFQHVRKTIYTAIERGNELLDGSLTVAKQTDEPRAYEVAQMTLKTLSDVAKDLLAIRKTRKEIKGFTSKGQPQISQGNTRIDKALFIGATSDLLKTTKENPQAILNIIAESRAASQEPDTGEQSA